MTDQPPPNSPPAGWYPDANLSDHYRWWDGNAWTDQLQAVQLAPPPAPASSPGVPQPPPVWNPQPAAPYEQPTVQVPAPYEESTLQPPESAPYPLPPAAYPLPPAANPSHPAASTQYPPPYPPTLADGGRQPRSRNALAIWSLVLGALGILIFLVPFVGLTLGATALTFGIIGIRKARSVGRGRGMAIAGVVTGALATAIGLAVTISLVSYVANASNDVRGAQESSAIATADPSETARPSETAGPSETTDPSDAAPRETAAADVAAMDEADFLLES